MWKRSKWMVLMAALVVASWLPLAQATITDDINPQDFNVHVGLVNNESVRYTGELTVYADLGGTVDKSIVPFTIEANGSLTVTATFKDAVVSVVGVSITEEPDPT